ncbi:Xaa-Pro peptidase family protein [Granulosicoccus sp.]|nr:Xaa-Pro peptidase family protein [Granulosicoccus sp.]
MNDSRPYPPARGFDTGEFETRCAYVQSNMRDRNIDIIWCTTEADIQYLTGYQTQFWQSPTRPWYLLLPQSGEPVAIIPTIGFACMQRTWITDIRLWSSPDPVDDGVTLLIDAIRELAGPTPRIGTSTSRETYLRCCLDDLQCIRSALAGAHWVDSTNCIRTVRQIKSEAEILKLRHITEVTSRAFAKVPDIIHSGMTDTEAFRRFKITCLEQGADDCRYLVGAASAGGYADIISPPNDHFINSGDVLILDTGCVFDGYHSDFDRNFALTRVDEMTCTAHHRVWDATEAGLGAVRAGVQCSDVFDAMQKVLQGDNARTSDAGAHVGRMGHGLGIELTETPSIAKFDETRLRAGMVITLEPGCNYSDNRMMVHEENLVVTEDGYELLSKRASRDIPIIG